VAAPPYHEKEINKMNENMRQRGHDVRFLPVVDSIIVAGRTINILCAGDYEEACRRLFRYAQSLPPARQQPKLPDPPASEDGE
jgi:hypothetical protein